MIQRPSYLSRIHEEYHNRDTVLFLVGARQVGKSTLIAMAKEQGIINASRTRSTSGDLLIGKDFLTGQDFLAYVAHEMDPASVDCICIDEAQYITNIGIILKHLIDMVRAGTYSFKIIVTGSGSLNVFKGMSDTLTGRKMIIPVYPLSFQEFLGHKGKKLLPHPSNFDDYHRLFAEYSTFGGFPQVVTTTNPEQKKTLFVQLLNDYLFKDVVMLLQEKEFGNFRRFLTVIAHKIGSMVTTEQLVQEVGISRYMIEKFLYVVENTFLFGIVRPFVGGKISGEIRKMFKFYINDLGMLRFLLAIHERTGEQQGKVCENFVYLSLLTHKKPYQDIYFWATKHHGEIDFVLVDQFDHTIIPIEVKSGDKDNLGSSYLHFLSTYQSSLSQAICTTKSLTKIRTVGDHHIHFVPYLTISTLFQS